MDIKEINERVQYAKAKPQSDYLGDALIELQKLYFEQQEIIEAQAFEIARLQPENEGLSDTYKAMSKVAYEVQAERDSLRAALAYAKGCMNRQTTDYEYVEQLERNLPLETASEADISVVENGYMIYPNDGHPEQFPPMLSRSEPANEAGEQPPFTQDYVNGEYPSEEMAKFWADRPIEKFVLDAQPATEEPLRARVLRVLANTTSNSMSIINLMVALDMRWADRKIRGKVYTELQALIGEGLVKFFKTPNAYKITRAGRAWLAENGG